MLSKFPISREAHWRIQLKTLENWESGGFLEVTWRFFRPESAWLFNVVLQNCLNFPRELLHNNVVPPIPPLLDLRSFPAGMTTLLQSCKTLKIYVKLLTSRENSVSFNLRNNFIPPCKFWITNTDRVRNGDCSWRIEWCSKVDCVKNSVAQ